MTDSIIMFIHIMSASVGVGASVYCLFLLLPRVDIMEKGQDLDESALSYKIMELLVPTVFVCLLLLVGWGSRLLWTITAFTLGHSITLALVTLGFFDYPVSLVEFTIALSIFVLALELARRGEGGLFRRYPWWLAGGFGLLHGMGFAGALAEAGLPQDNVPLALLFFNIGIEIGQVTFIFIVMAIWWLLRRPLAPLQDRLLPVPVYILGGLSAMWCIERGIEVFV